MFGPSAVRLAGADVFLLLERRELGLSRCWVLKDHVIWVLKDGTYAEVRGRKMGA